MNWQVPAGVKKIQLNESTMGQQKPSSGKPLCGILLHNAPPPSPVEGLEEVVDCDAVRGILLEGMHQQRISNQRIEQSAMSLSLGREVAH